MRGKLIRSPLYKSNYLTSKDTLTLTNASANKVRVAQRAIERSIVGISLRDKKTNEWIR